jgi:hypothetical protein
MKIKELVEKLDGLEDEEREKWIYKLMDKFTPESLGTIINFQNEWMSVDMDRPWEEFVEAQNKVILDCVKLEESQIGTDVRTLRGLPIWNNEEELE